MWFALVCPPWFWVSVVKFCWFVIVCLIWLKTGRLFGFRINKNQESAYGFLLILAWMNVHPWFLSNLLLSITVGNRHPERWFGDPTVLKLLGTHRVRFSLVLFCFQSVVLHLRGKAHRVPRNQVWSSFETLLRSFSSPRSSFLDCRWWKPTKLHSSSCCQFQLAFEAEMKAILQNPPSYYMARQALHQPVFTVLIDFPFVWNKKEFSSSC